MTRVAFCTLGCKVNQYETEAMRTSFQAAGYQAVPFDEPADVYVVNTCTVTNMSDKKSRQLISRAHGKNPEALIAVVGCYSQRAPEDVASLPGVSLILGTKDRGRIVELVERAREAKLNLVSDIHLERDFETLPVPSTGERTRAQLKIQDGCDRYCSYCIIPYARGPVRSMPLAEVHRSVEKLGASGFREIVITGIHLMSYGKDFFGGISLLDAVREAASVPGIERIRLGSLEPALIDEAFALALSREDKVLRQFHLALQSGSDAVLSRMNRRYTTKEFSRAAEQLRQAMPGCAITTDVIAGFVGETQAEHEETMAFVEKMRFARMHVFPYSRREGTKAANLPGHLPKAVKDGRARALIALCERLEAGYVEEQIGTVQSVLVEDVKDGQCAGYSGNYVHVTFPGTEALEGEIVPVLITAAAGDRAMGEIVLS